MEIVNLSTLKEKKLISKSVNKVKIFGNSSLDSKVTIEGITVSKGAKESIEKAGGKIVEANTKKEIEEGDKE